jgi:hypothetical protein
LAAESTPGDGTSLFEQMGGTITGPAPGSPVPAEAITVGAAAISTMDSFEFGSTPKKRIARMVLEAAAPVLRVAERERCQAFVRDAAAEYRDCAIAARGSSDSAENYLIARALDEVADLLAAAPFGGS